MENKVNMPLTNFQKQVKEMTPEEKRAMHARITQIIEEKRAAAAAKKKQSLVVSINLGKSEPEPEQKVEESKKSSRRQAYIWMNKKLSVKWSKKMERPSDDHILCAAFEKVNELTPGIMNEPFVVILNPETQSH